MRARFSPPDAFPVTFAELAAFAGRNPVLSMLLAGLTVAILVTEAMRLLRGGQRLARYHAIACSLPPAQSLARLMISSISRRRPCVLAVRLRSAR